MLESELIDEIKFNLGHPTVKVELDENTWQRIISKSIRWFKAKKGLINCYALPITTGVTEYNLPANTYAIVDVVLPSSTSSLFPALCDLGLEAYPAVWFGYTPSNPMRIDVSWYAQLLQNLEMRRRIFGNEGETWYVSCNKLYIPSPESGNAIVFAKPDIILVSDLKGRDEQIIFEYALAVTKHILGRLRSKYGAYPAAGGPINMDGDSLISEAMVDFERLENEISDSQGNAGGLVVG